MTCYIGHDSQMTDAELLDERKIVDRSTRLQTTQCEDYILSFFASEGRSWSDPPPASLSNRNTQLSELFCVQTMSYSSVNKIWFYRKFSQNVKKIYTK